MGENGGFAETLDIKYLRSFLLGWVVASVVVGLMGPFSTYLSLGLGERILYWGLMVGLAIPLSLWIRFVFRRVFDVTGQGAGFSVAALQAICVGPLMWLFNLYVFDFCIVSALRLLEHVIVVFMVCFGAILVQDAFWSASGQRVAGPLDNIGQNAQIVERTLLDRAGIEGASRINHMSAANHYVLLYTDAGEGRILMRFGDAMWDARVLDGYRIHRSHWVARDQLAAVRLDGRRYFAVLEGGAELPISSAYLPQLKQAGFAVV